MQYVSAVISNYSAVIQYSNAVAAVLWSINLLYNLLWPGHFRVERGRGGGNSKRETKIISGKKQKME